MASMHPGLNTAYLQREEKTVSTYRYTHICTHSHTYTHILYSRKTFNFLASLNNKEEISGGGKKGNLRIIFQTSCHLY